MQATAPHDIAYVFVRAGALLRRLGIALADGLAHHDGRGVRDAEDHNRGKLLNGVGDGVRGDGIPLAVCNMPEYDRLQRDGEGPRDLVDQHRAAVFENIFGKRAVVREHVPQPEAQALVDEEDIDADDHEFKQPRRQRRNGRALDAERGRAEIAEDQHPVEEYVCGERREVDHHRYFYNLDRAQAAYKGVAESEGKIGVAEYAQIFGAAFDHGRAVGVQAHDVLGEQQHGQPQNNRDENHRFEHNGEYDAHAGVVFFSHSTAR